MHRIIATLLIVCCFLLLTLSVSAQLLSPTVQFQGSFDLDATSVFLGSMDIDVSFHGFSSSDFDLTQSDMFPEDIAIHPFLKAITIPDLQSVKVLDINNLPVELENATMQDFSTLLTSDVLPTYSQVTLQTTDFSLVGLTEGTMDLDSSFHYGIAGFAQFPITDEPMPFFLLVTNHALTMSHQGSSAMLMQLEDSGSVQLLSNDGDLLTSSSDSSVIYLIGDPSFSILQQGSVSFYPLSSTSDDHIDIIIEEADLQDASLLPLVDNISSSFSAFGEDDDSDFMGNIEDFSDIIDMASSIINGGMIIYETDEPVLIDDNQHTFSTFGFLRGSHTEVSYQPVDETIEVAGEFKLIFLGDHFYTTQAPTDEHGITVPILIILLWIIALVFFFVRKMYLPTPVKEELSKQLKRYALIIHIIIIITTFILVDYEIGFQFGASFFSLLASQGFTLLLGIFLAVQLLMWVLGYLLMAFPMGLLANTILRYFGIDKQGKGLGKAVGILFIWVFTAFYVKLILNLALYWISPENLFPM